MSSFKARDGSSVTDGAKATLTLGKGSTEARETALGGPPLADYSEREVTGVIRSFDQDGETRWEVLTDSEQYPAIGFLPEHVIRVA